MGIDQQARECHPDVRKYQQVRILEVHAGLVSVPALPGENQAAAVVCFLDDDVAVKGFLLMDDFGVSSCDDAAESEYEQCQQ